MLSVILGILSAVCLAYFGIISFYSGIKTSAVWIWLALAVVFFLLSQGNVYYHQHKHKVPLWIPVSLATLCTAGVVIFVILQILIFGGMIRTAPEHLDYLIVLGAKVREDDISSSLKHRLDKAIRFAQEHPETKLVLSGGQGEGEPTAEAQAMAEYLAYNGIAREQMLLESVSTSTTENMLYSKRVIDEQREQEKESLQREQLKESLARLELSMALAQLETEEEAKVEEHVVMLESPTDPEEEKRREMIKKIRENLAKGEGRQRKSYGPAQEFYSASSGSQDANLEAQMQVYPGAAELLPDKPLQIGVLTSNFHLYRAMKIGEKCGFEHLYGVASTADPVLFIHLCVRESIAILKDKFMGNM